MLSKRILEVIPFSIRVIRRLSLQSLSGTMPLQQLRILLLIQEGKRQTEMAELLQVTPAAISKSIHVLVEKKFAARKTSLPDRRMTELTLTKHGQKVLGQVFGHVENQFEKNIKKLTKKELEQLNQGLIVLEKLMGQFNEA